MNTEPNTTTATELLENLRQMLDLPTCLDLAAASALSLVECVNALESRISTTETKLTELSDQVATLRSRCSDLHDDLSDAEAERDLAQEEAKELRNAVGELRDLSAAAADELHDRHPHLLDDLLDYTAHLRHTSADRKTIALLELTTSTLRTISSLLN